MRALWTVAFLAAVVAQKESPLCDKKIHARSSLADPLIAEMADGLSEGCNYAKLVEKYIDRTMKQTDYKENSTEWKLAEGEIKKSLTKVMPNGNDKDNTVNIWYLDITDLYSFVAHEINIRGFLLLSWDDYRLGWKYEDDMRVDRLKIQHASSIWTPDINYVLSKNSFSNAGNRDTTLNRNGTVFHHLGFWVRSTCQVDLSEYPTDVQHCCLDFQSQSYPKFLHKVDLLKMELKDGAKVNVAISARQRFWKIRGTGSLIKKRDREGNDLVQACFDLVRPSATLTYFILLPLWATAVLVILVPLFTDWKFQISAKFMGLLLQYISLGMTMSDDIKEAMTVPKYLKMYEMLIWVTTVSLSITCILWAMSRKRMILPPPPPLLALADRINPFFCGNVVHQGEANEVLEERIEESGTSKANGGDISENGLTKTDFISVGEWTKVFVGLNNLWLITCTAAYILGIIIICA